MATNFSLLSDSSDSEVDFKVNKSYADNYNNWRNKEELQKLKDLSKDISESSSSSEEEVPEIEEDFLKTLSLLKSKDPKIYDKDATFYKDQPIDKKPKAHKPKPLFMKDFERKLVLERNGEFSEDEELFPKKGPSYGEEQDEIKMSFNVDEDADDEDFLQFRQNSKEEKDAEEADHLLWLKGQKEVPEDTGKEMSFLRNYWNNPKLDESEKFLKDFILDKKYIVNDNDGEIPTYDEITGDVEMLVEDEKILEQQETFEHKYNFRFEEPDEEFIKRYPRTVGDSLRRVDNRRKARREEYAERKKKEKEQKREELKRLKALKRKEIEEKFMKLKEISGQDEINFNEDDIESDFDPDKHDQKMKELFNDVYYNVEEEQMPKFPYDEELDDENWNTWSREKAVTKEDEEGSAVSDEVEEIFENANDKAVNDGLKKEFEDEMIESTQSRKKKGRKKSLFAKIIAEPKPLYDPDGKSFEEYVDEYYKLDYEDIIGDLPVRYKYRKVLPNNFGLTAQEILAANDRELNRWCSIKKTCQYRDDDEELYDKQAFEKKAANEFTKKKVFQSLYSEPEGKDSAINSVKESNLPGTNESKSKKKRKKKKVSSNEDVLNESFNQKLLSEEIKDNVISNKEENLDTKMKDNVSENLYSVQNIDTITSGEKGSDPETNKCKKKRKKKKKISFDNNLIHNQNVVSEEFTDKKINSVVSNLENSLVTKSKKRSRTDEDEITVPDVKHCNAISKAESFNKKSKKRRKSNETSDQNSKIYHGNKSGFKNIIPQSERMEISKESVADEACKSLNLSENVEINTPKKNVSVPQEKDGHPGEIKSSKKKRKKKTTQLEESSSKIYKNMFSKKKPNVSKKYGHHKQQAKNTSDKRLQMSDARLAAYGINPKKFKNRIIYS